MTPGQNRVLGLLALLLALEAIKQPAVKAQLTAVWGTITGNVAAAQQSSSAAQFTLPDLKLMLYWGAGATALVLLAAPAPDAATWLVVILLALVVLSDVGAYTALFKPPAAQPSAQKG